MDEQTFTCGRCGKIKKENEGSFTAEEKKFCCEKCCPKPGEEKPDKTGGLCEFC